METLILSIILFVSNLYFAIDRYKNESYKIAMFSAYAAGSLVIAIIINLINLTT